MQEIKEMTRNKVREIMTGNCKECGRSPPRSDSEDSDISFKKTKVKKTKEDEEVINPYPEIVIPNEFQIKFETDKKIL